MPLVALTFALLAVGAATFVALRLARGEQRRAEALVTRFERLGAMTENERGLARSELVREVETARRGSRSSEVALLRVLIAAFGIGIIGAAGWLVQLGPDAVVGQDEAGQRAIHPGALAIAGLGVLALVGTGVVVFSMRARRASLQSQRQLLSRLGG